MARLRKSVSCQSRLSWTMANDRRGELEMMQRLFRIRAAPGDDGDDPESIIRDLRFVALPACLRENRGLQGFWPSLGCSLK